MTRWSSLEQDLLLIVDAIRELLIESADPLRVGWDNQSGEHEYPSPVYGEESKRVTHVSGMKCYLCPRNGPAVLPDT